jgi:hypothetical protein
VVSLAQVSPTLEGRYTNTQRHLHSKFDQGMIRDIASWELPEGGMYDAADVLCDFAGKVRKRGGTTSPAAGNSAATVENLLSYRSGAIDGLTGVWGSLGKSGLSIQSFNTSTGATTSVYTSGSVNTIACRPFQYLNLMVFPFQATGFTTNDRNWTLFCGGGTTNTVGNDIAGTVTAGDNRITGMTAAPLVAGHLGCLIMAQAVGKVYIGRVIEVTSTTACRVEPTPTVGFTIGTVVIINQMLWSQNATDEQVTGRFGCSYQGRMVLGYTCRTGPSTSDLAKGLVYESNRVAWSTLTTENPTLTWSPAKTPDGYLFLAGCPVTTFNFVDIPNLGGMTGLAAAGEGQLVVFGQGKTFRISGTLATETVLSPSFSFSVDQISANVGIDRPIATGDRPDRSIQYSSEGLIFASANGIYVYDGSQMRPLLQGKNARYYQDRRRAGNIIHGSFFSLPKNHYYLSMSGSDGGLCINLDTLALTRFTNVDVFDAVPDPVDATKLWGARWWDTTGAAPTMTKGQLIGLESIWLPTSANKTDADGTAVIADIQTAAYVDGETGANKVYTDINLTYKLAGSGSPTLTLKADTQLDTSSATFATLDAAVPTATNTITKAEQEIGPLLAEGQAIEFRLTTNASCDTFELDVLDIGMHHGPPGFST